MAVGGSGLADVARSGANCGTHPRPATPAPRFSAGRTRGPEALELQLEDPHPLVERLRHPPERHRLMARHLTTLVGDPVGARAIACTMQPLHAPNKQMGKRYDAIGPLP